MYFACPGAGGAASGTARVNGAGSIVAGWEERRNERQSRKKMLRLRDTKDAAEPQNKRFVHILSCCI